MLKWIRRELKIDLFEIKKNWKDVINRELSLISSLAQTLAKEKSKNKRQKILKGLFVLKLRITKIHMLLNHRWTDRRNKKIIDIWN